MRAFLVLLALAVSLVTPAGTPAAESDRVGVYFTRGEHLTLVEREVRPRRTPLGSALAALVEGPTAAERERGLRTSIPRGTAFRGVRVESGVAVVDLSARFAAGSDEAVLNARLTQVVYTATRFAGVAAVALALDGRRLSELRGVSLDPPLRRGDFAPPPFGGMPTPPPPQGRPRAEVRRLQARLVELGYLPRGSESGLVDAATRSATIAFQKWEGIARDGIAGRQTKGRLARATRPTPLFGPASGRRIEVSLRKQVAVLVDGGRVVRVVHVSTGAPASPTPAGSYAVYRKETRSWSVPFRQWLPWASYFVRGIAFHEYPDVPVYPASHGCVRVPADDAPFVYRFARMGTRVVVR